MMGILFWGISANWSAFLNPESIQSWKGSFYFIMCGGSFPWTASCDSMGRTAKEQEMWVEEGFNSVKPGFFWTPGCEGLHFFALFFLPLGWEIPRLGIPSPHSTRQKKTKPVCIIKTTTPQPGGPLSPCPFLKGISRPTLLSPGGELSRPGF